MSEGIRSFCNAKFAELLPQRKELTDTGFRRAVMTACITQFNITLASSATHYNHSLKEARKNDPKSVADLGRDPAKKGGAKPKHLYQVSKVKTGEVIATGLSKEAADAMVAMAVSKKKAKLVAEEQVAETATVVEPTLDTSAVETTVIAAVDLTDSVPVAITEATVEEVA